MKDYGTPPNVEDHLKTHSHPIEEADLLVLTYKYVPGSEPTHIIKVEVRESQTPSVDGLRTIWEQQS